MELKKFENTDNLVKSKNGIKILKSLIISISILMLIGLIRFVLPPYIFIDGLIFTNIAMSIYMIIWLIFFFSYLVKLKKQYNNHIKLKILIPLIVPVFAMLFIQKIEKVSWNLRYEYSISINHKVFVKIKSEATVPSDSLINEFSFHNNQTVKNAKIIVFDLDKKNYDRYLLKILPINLFAWNNKEIDIIILLQKETPIKTNWKSENNGEIRFIDCERIYALVYNYRLKKLIGKKNFVAQIDVDKLNESFWNGKKEIYISTSVDAWLIGIEKKL